MKEQAAQNETSKEQPVPLPSGKKPMSPEEAAEKRQALAVLETYMRLKQGVSPTSDVQKQRRSLEKFNLSGSQVRDANFAIAAQASPNCQKFVKVYNDVLEQQSYYFGQLLSENKPSQKVRQALEARLKILQFFERTLFGLVLMKAEGGQSQLDQGVRRVCATDNRPQWSNLLLKSHQDLETLHAQVLGEPSAMAIADEAQGVRQLNDEHYWDQTGKQAIWVLGEIAASIALWEKGLHPWLRAVVGVAGRTPLGRLILGGAGTVYVMGWVAFDRAMRERLPFLQPEPQILAKENVSSWENTIQLGQDFLVADLFSPPLYFAYVELLSVMRKQMAWDFLNENKALLQRAEQEFGTIERAIERTKEVLRHEHQENSNRDADPIGTFQLGAANGF